MDDSRSIAKVPRPVSGLISLLQNVDLIRSAYPVTDESPFLSWMIRTPAPPVTIRSFVETILAAFWFVSKMSSEAFNLSASFNPRLSR